MTSLLKSYIDKVISTPEGEAFLGYLLTDMGVFNPQTDPAKIAVQQYAIGLLGKLDLYTEHGRFQVDYVNALVRMPRTPRVQKENDDE
jgi:hypothetical protein